MDKKVEEKAKSEVVEEEEESDDNVPRDKEYVTNLLPELKKRFEEKKVNVGEIGSKYKDKKKPEYCSIKKFFKEVKEKGVEIFNE